MNCESEILFLQPTRSKFVILVDKIPGKYQLIPTTENTESIQLSIKFFFLTFAPVPEGGLVTNFCYWGVALN